ncbi:MAG: hypothetical protein ACRENO_07460 [Thermodesulfobacteriota bacterium]
MFKIAPLSFIFLILILNSYLSAGELYKTKGEGGDFKYTNIKPKDENEAVVEIKTYSHRQQTENPKIDPYLPEASEDKINTEKQEYVNDLFRKKAISLYEKEKSIENSVLSTKENISNLENVIEDFLVNGYFADNYIFELRVQESNLNSFEQQLEEIKEEKNELKIEARKSNVDPGVLRVK